MIKFYKKFRKYILISGFVLSLILFWNLVYVNSALAHGSFGNFFNFSNFRNFHIWDFRNYFHHKDDDGDHDDDENEDEHHEGKDGKLDCGFNGGSIFNVNNMLPGDSKEKIITVKNNSNSQVKPVLKGFRTGPLGEVDPLFETVLDFEIFENATLVYSNKLNTFFADSSQNNKVLLTPISGNQQKKYKLVVYFPSISDNEYQLKKVVFKLTCERLIVATPTPSPKPTPTIKPRPTHKPSHTPTPSPKPTPTKYERKH